MNPFLALIDACTSGADPREALGHCFRAVGQLDAAGMTRLLSEIDAHLRRHPPEQMGPVALLAGGLVENGLDPRRFPPAVFDRLVEFLSAIPEREDEENPYELPDAWSFFERAAVACLTRSAEVRLTFPQRAALMERMRRYQEQYGFLGKALAMLDGEPFTIIDLPTGRGWRFIVGGIGDNFEFHFRLLRALAGRGDDGLPGPRPDVDAEHLKSRWQLATWRALETERTLEKGHENWIWNEGLPAEIPPFEDTRVVVVAPSTLERSWNGGAVFPWVTARFEQVARLPDAEVAALLKRMLSAR